MKDRRAERSRDRLVPAAAAVSRGAARILFVAVAAAVVPGQTADAPETGAVRSPPRLLRLRSGTFDPAEDRRAPSPDALKPDGDCGLWIVQFHSFEKTTAADEALRRAGATISDYVPDAARLVLAPPDFGRRAAAWPFVRSVVPLRPNDRLPASETAKLLAADPSSSSEWTAVLAVDGSVGRKHALMEILGPLGATATIPRRDGGRTIALKLTPPAVVAALRSDHVVWMEPRPAARGDMEVVRRSFGAHDLEHAITPGFLGAGVAGEILDFQPRPTHVDLPGMLIHGETSVPTQHGTASTSIAFGRGLSRADARGMLPAGTPIAAFAHAPSIRSDRYGRAVELLSPPFEAIFQSNGFGSGSSPTYDAASFELDEIAFDLDLAVFQSIGNRAGTSCRPEGWAKNVTTVGAVRHRGTEDRADDAWEVAAGFGPAADGRRKPDLVGFGDGIVVASHEADDATFAHFGGTSAATPQVAGAAGLLAEMWARGVFGENPAGGSVFDRRPRPATLKALLVASARPYPFEGGGGDLARVRQGYGTPDLRAAYDAGVAGLASVVDERAPLLEGGSFVREIDVPPSTPALRAALVWCDPPAPPCVASQRVNDLDLEAIDPEGVRYFGGVGLDDGPWSAAGGVRDAVDTVECVFVRDPRPGRWRVVVHAREIHRDGRPETAAVDADFALVILGGRRTAPIEEVAAGIPSNRPVHWLVHEKATHPSGDGPGYGAARVFDVSARRFGPPTRFKAGGLGAARRVVAMFVESPPIGCAGDAPRAPSIAEAEAFTVIADERVGETEVLTIDLDVSPLPFGAVVLIRSVASTSREEIASVAYRATVE